MISIYSISLGVKDSLYPSDSFTHIYSSCWDFGTQFVFHVKPGLI
jgi:hypothetical protein